MVADDRHNSAEGPIAEPEPLGPVGISRRRFTKNVGAGSAAALGLMFAAPKISTIRYAARAAVGSPPPPGSTTTTTTTPGRTGRMTVDEPNPCAGTAIHIHAEGFVPKTAVMFALDSPAHVLGTTTANGDGRVNVTYNIPVTGPFGAHEIKATGVQPGGKTLVLSAPITIRTVADCHQGTQGSTVPGTGSSSPPTTVPTTTPATSPQAEQGGQSLQQGSKMPFTGMNSTDLALAGGAAALAGWALYGIGGSGDRDDNDESAR
jgi:hypothetical protein